MTPELVQREYEKLSFEDKVQFRFNEVMSNTNYLFTIILSSVGTIGVLLILSGLAIKSGEYTIESLLISSGIVIFIHVIILLIMYTFTNREVLNHNVNKYILGKRK